MAGIRINTPHEIACLRASARELAGIMEQLIAVARPGVETFFLGELAERLIREKGGDPIFKGYGKAWGAPAFPAAVCLSVNEEVVHGIPKVGKVLREGDLLKIDIGMRYHGMISDMARTVAIGKVSDDALRILQVTEDSLLRGISVLRDGATLETYARAVETLVQESGFSCVRDLVGHGVGRELHEDPQIPNFTGSRLPHFAFQSGMSVALEPMVNAGHYGVELATDGWTFITKDRKLSAHFEDTVLITAEGSEILTRPASTTL